MNTNTIIITVSAIVTFAGLTCLFFRWVWRQEDKASAAKAVEATPEVKKISQHLEADPYESFWFGKYQWVYFLRDAEGKVLERDWRVEKVRWQAEFQYNRNQLALPAEIVRRTKHGAEVVVEEYFVEDGIAMQRVHLDEGSDGFGQQTLMKRVGDLGLVPPSDPSLN